MTRPTEPHPDQADWVPTSTGLVDTVASELSPPGMAFDGANGWQPTADGPPSYLAGTVGEWPDGSTPFDSDYLWGATKSAYPYEVSAWPAPPSTWGDPSTWVAVNQNDGNPLQVRVPAAWTTGYFVTDPTSGYDVDELKPGFMTVGELCLYRANTWEPDPEPGPEPALSELAAATLRHAGMPADETTPAELAELAEAHAAAVALQVRGYTRGRGFIAPDPEQPDDEQPDRNLRAVIASAAARSMSNPTGAESVKLGEATYRPGQYVGWTLPELAILNVYRKRQA